MNFIDLFAGAGGLSEGFKKAGFTPIAHVESNQSACFTLKTRIAYYYLKNTNQPEEYYKYLRGEINRKELYSKIPNSLLSTVINAFIGKNNSAIFNKIDKFKGEEDIDLIIGGPPCQAYSYIGRAALKHKKRDQRKTLYKHYGKFLERYRPKFFVFENVPGLKTADNGKHYSALQTYFRKLGYKMDDRELNSYDFGVIQNRRRLIIIGWREDIDFSYPEFEKIEHNWTRDDIFSDLEAVKPAHHNRISYYTIKTPNNYLRNTEIRNGVDFVTQHITRPHNNNDLNIYKLAIKKLQTEGRRLKNDEIPENQRTQQNVEDFLDRFKVIDILPHTMIAHIAKDGHHFIHPDIKQLRSISVREAARIQSFPDDFYFEGIKEKQPRTAAFTQIGNAVPPLMAYKIAIALRNQLG
ncbi:DNA cytosine methyltransferase [Parafilimonas sp.]|uniref:DNA cytosine methyltransferase n=1 Tax=Parafilimonas sp. TaxID=1969739 RepID=UPI0039E4FD0B